MRSKISIATFLLFTCAPIFASPIFEIRKIAGKSEYEIFNILGPSVLCKSIRQGKKCVYRNGQIEVVFISGKADWITINGLSQTRFSPSALTAIGLEESEPTTRTPLVIRWEPIQGLNSVSIFKGDTGVDYAYVKVKTR